MLSNLLCFVGSIGFMDFYSGGFDGGHLMPDIIRVRHEVDEGFDERNQALDIMFIGGNAR